MTEFSLQPADCQIFIIGLPETGKTSLYHKIKEKQGNTPRQQILLETMQSKNFFQIRSLIYNAILTLATCATDMKKEYSPSIQELFDDLKVEYDPNAENYSPSIVGKLQKLWKDPITQEVFRNRHMTPIIENLDYLMERSYEIFQPSYHPSQEDLLHFSIATTQPDQFLLTYQGKTFNIVDFPGDPDTFRAWKLMFPKADIIIHVSSISDFDHPSLIRNHNQIRYFDDIDLLQSYIHLPSISNIRIFLILSKIDIIERRSQEGTLAKSIRHVFPKYNFGDESLHYITYITNQYLQITNLANIYPFFLSLFEVRGPASSQVTTYEIFIENLFKSAFQIIQKPKPVQNAVLPPEQIPEPSPLLPAPPPPTHPQPEQTLDLTKSIMKTTSVDFKSKVTVQQQSVLLLGPISSGKTTFLRSLFLQSGGFSKELKENLTNKIRTHLILGLQKVLPIIKSRNDDLISDFADAAYEIIMDQDPYDISPANYGDLVDAFNIFNGEVSFRKYLANHYHELGVDYYFIYFINLGPKIFTENYNMSDNDVLRAFDPTINNCEKTEKVISSFYFAFYDLSGKQSNQHLLSRLSPNVQTFVFFFPIGEFDLIVSQSKVKQEKYLDQCLALFEKVCSQKENHNKNFFVIFSKYDILTQKIQKKVPFFMNKIQRIEMVDEEEYESRIVNEFEQMFISLAKKHDYNREIKFDILNCSDPEEVQDFISEFVFYVTGVAPETITLDDAELPQNRLDMDHLQETLTLSSSF